MKTNMQLHTDVLAELSWDPRVTEKEIGVAVKDGVVTLTGSVASYAAKWVAEHAVERVAGVKAVANDLTVKIPGGSIHSDTEIAHKVVETFARDVEVPDDKIRVSVTNGWVTLEGQVDWKFQHDVATRAVRNLAGVRGVTNVITVLPKQGSSDGATCGIK